MDVVVSLISDLIILVFDLALYIKLTPLKKDNLLYRSLMYGGVFLITAAYMIVAYVLHVPYAAASFCCMTVPSFLLFLFLSKYKNARFLVTFCFVDTVTFIIAVCAKLALILGGIVGGISSCVLLLLLTVGAYLTLLPYCAKYRELMDQVAKGWNPMALSTVLIYLLLSFSAMYPAPLVSRLEYVPVYLLLCVTVLSFYVVFIVLLIQKAKVMQTNQLLKQQQHWHHMAYVDELTQLANQAAYDARTDTLEKELPHQRAFAVIVFDIDNFKKVNDTYGHLFGNQVLKKSADFFLSSFPKDSYEFFRIGGDEFAAIAVDVPEEELQNRIEKINTTSVENELGCTFSCGYAQVDFSREHAFEDAFIKADQFMYSVKTKKKIQH